MEFRIAETPVFLPWALLEEMASEGVQLTQSLLGNAAYLVAARKAIPAGYDVAGETAHPNFLTADFALVRDASGNLVPRLVEIQAFPSVYGYQQLLSEAYRDAFALPGTLGSFLGGLDEAGYWALLGKTVLGGHDPQNVVLTELDPRNQKTLPDFEVTARRLGIAVVDIRSLEPVGEKLHYRDSAGRLAPIHRIYNRAIADELMARQVRLPVRSYAWVGCGVGRASELVFPDFEVLHTVAVATGRGASSGAAGSVFGCVPRGQRPGGAGAGGRGASR